MLWLCLDLPFLSLEVCTRASVAAEAFAVSEGSGRAQQVLIANEVAMRAGIRPGMSLSAAHVLVSPLHVVARDDVAEHAALERLAAWAGQFTSHVTLVSPHALLLEVEGSLTLFGSLKRLRHALRTGIAALGYSAVLSIAPTPLAATWFARGADEEPVTDLPALAGRLFDMPLNCLGLPAEQYRLLQGMGLTTLGECLRLPRDGLARRLGAEFVIALDRAFGRLPDPRKFYVAPATFEARLPLPGAVDNAEGILFPLNRLLFELSGFLTARVAGVQELELVLHHPATGFGAGARPPATRIELGLAHATRDAKHLGELFRERLARIALTEPVEEILLSASRLLPLTASEADFFASTYARSGAASELIERLSARLGRDAVHGLSTVAEHRPERAWQYLGARAFSANGMGRDIAHIAAERPLWLLEKPVRLDVQDGQPRLEGALALESDNERIESGWWDGKDVRRDYFVAHDTEGARWWVYRELGGERNWWLQGVFG